MGLFDKKKSDDFNSPVERIDLSSMTAPVPASQVTAPPAGRSVIQPPPEPEPQRYGINQAIELMRTLPQDNVELVVQVVKRTLESTHIRIDTIIQDAARKQADIEGRINVLKQEIAELERDIATRRNEIAALDTDHKETTLVKDRLVLAEKLTNAPQPVIEGLFAGAHRRFERDANRRDRAFEQLGRVSICGDVLHGGVDQQASSSGSAGQVGVDQCDERATKPRHEWSIPLEDVEQLGGCLVAVAGERGHEEFVFRAERPVDAAAVETQPIHKVLDGGVCVPPLPEEVDGFCHGGVGTDGDRR